MKRDNLTLAQRRKVVKALAILWPLPSLEDMAQHHALVCNICRD